MTSRDVIEMTRENSCCHQSHVRVRSRRSGSRLCGPRQPIALADPARRARRVGPTLSEFAKDRLFFGRPTNWPVRSPVTTTPKTPDSTRDSAAGGGLPARRAGAAIPAAARRRAGRLAAQRAGQLQPLLRRQRRGRRRWPLLTQARLVRVNRATDALEPALAETLGRVARRPDADVEAAEGRHLLRRRARSRPPTCCSRSPSPTTRPAASSATSITRRRPAAGGHAPRTRATVVIQFAGAVRAGHPHARQPADPAAAQARGRRFKQRHDPEGLDCRRRR